MRLGRAVVAAIILATAVTAATGSAASPPTRTGSVLVTGLRPKPGPGIFRLDLGSGRVTRLTSAATDQSPALSRDGKQVAFSREIPDPKTRKPIIALFIVNIDGTGLHRVGRMQGLGASWGPGDRELVFGAVKGIAVVRPDGTGLRSLRSSGTAPAWSPDGRTILFVDGGAVDEMRADGGGAHTIAKPPSSAKHLYLDYAPAWAPDGTRISFVELDGLSTTGGGGLLETAKADGSDLHTAVRLDTWNPLSGTPTWSPDSRDIAFVDAPGGDKPELLAVAGAGGAPSRLPEGSVAGAVWVALSGWGAP